MGAAIPIGVNIILQEYNCRDDDGFGSELILVQLLRSS